MPWFIKTEKFTEEGVSLSKDQKKAYIDAHRDWVNSLVLELDTLDYSKLIEEKYFKNQKGN